KLASDTDVKTMSTKAEAELQREEEEMLAMTRLLKQVDGDEALTVAKQILETTPFNQDDDAAADASTKTRLVPSQDNVVETTS
ncbi:hypothetical protein BGW38_010017, partial [Lunasporangiospora selenospora]